MAYEATIINKMVLEFSSLAANVGLARVAVAALAAQVDLTLDDLEEIKVATSEAVSNAIIHGYLNQPTGTVRVEGILASGVLTIIVTDQGRGIEDIEKAMEPAYSTDANRLGLGFVFMKSFMNSLEVNSEPGHGTTVTMTRVIRPVDKELALES